MQRYFRRNQLAKCWLCWGGLLVFFILFRYFIEEYLFLRWFGTHNYSRTSFTFYAFDNVYFGINTLLMSIFIWAVVNWKGLENEKNALAKEKNSAELNLLKSQVNPHFLFNTLNNIYSLVYKKSDQALPAIIRLSELMRFMIIDSGADQIALTKELGYIRRFIELESLRVANEGAVDFVIHGEVGSQRIAPLLLIPFIENGFKHGVLTDPGSPFVVDITVAESEVRLLAINKIDTAGKQGIPGMGLANVRKRLEILYSGRYSLKIDQQADKYICDLSIKL